MRFAFVTPRYGAEIGSGAEHLCRLIAEKVAERHDVDVLTTCARTLRTPTNDVPEGADKVRGVTVRRFAVSQTSDEHGFQDLSSRLFRQPHGRADELEWVRRLGPWSPGLIDYLKRQHRSYETIVFFSLLHPCTVHGLSIAPERSILFPYLQLSPALRFGLCEELLQLPRAVGYVAGREKVLAHRYVGVTPGFEEMVGIGIDPTPQQTYPRHQQDPADAPDRDADDPADTEAPGTPDYLEGRGVPFRRRHRLYGPVVLYGGRVEPGHGCEEMMEYFDGYAGSDGDATLVLMGVKMMKLPDDPYIRSAGVLPDRERMIAYEAADVTVAPAADDILAQPVLESFAVGTPVLVNAANLAAVEHCRRGGGGLYYRNREEFAEALRTIMSNPGLRARLGESGKQYVRQYYRWDGVLGRFDRLVGRVRKN